MSKRRKQQEPELPLFDLPLYDDPEPDDGLPLRPSDSDAQAAEPVEAPAPPKPRRKRRKKAEPQGPMLFSEEELSLGTARPAAPEPSRGAAKPAVPKSPRKPVESAQSNAGDMAFDPLDTDDGVEPEPSPGSEKPSALIQDRLLGGLADLTIHIATLGSMVVAVQLMGVPVALSDWPAFAGLAVIFSFLYCVVPLAFWGHTPGMAWVGHSARCESDEPLSFGQTAMRWAGALFTVILFGLPLLLALTDGGSLADRLSDSRTVQLD